MRKVIEMTFAGEDVRVLSVANAQDALAACRKEERIDVVLADVALGEGHSGYDLCRAIKDEFKGIPVIVLSSKQNPWDPARGQAAGADDHIDKPYDTTKTIDLVKKVLEQGRSIAPSPIAAAPAAGAPAAPRTPMFSPAAATPQPVAAAPVKISQAASPVANPTMQGMAAAGASSNPALQKQATPALQVQHTRRIEEPIPAPAAQTTRALQPQVTARMPSDAPPPEFQHATLAELAQQPQQGNGGGGALSPELSTKLQALGLTPGQVDAVLALSREVVERVVWEVVPVLAETLVKEEIARLTRS